MDPAELWPFAAVGFVVPGLSQIVFILAVRHAGASRAAILVGTAPLGSVLLALALLDEPLRPVLLVGTALVVAGGAALALDPGRPAGFRVLGVVLALTCAALFAARDNAVRWIARDDDVAPLQASAATLLAATLATVVYVVVTRRELSPTLARKRRAGVPPGRTPARPRLRRPRDGLRPRRGRDRRAPQRDAVALSRRGARLRPTEAIRRTVLAGVLVVLGGALIGAFR